MNIPEKLKAKFRDLTDDPAGERFENHYHRVHARGGNVILRKFVFLVGGVVVIALGIVFLPAPGPGMVIIALGAAMIAQESLVFAKALDRFEVWLRKVLKSAKKKWKGSSLPAKLTAMVALALCAAGLVYGSYALFTNLRGG